MSKEEILEKQGVTPESLAGDYAEVCVAMQEYADQQSLEFAKWAERNGYYFQDEMYGNKWQHMNDPATELTDTELLTRFKERP